RRPWWNACSLSADGGGGGGGGGSAGRASLSATRASSVGCAGCGTDGAADADGAGPGGMRSNAGSRGSWLVGSEGSGAGPRTVAPAAVSGEEAVATDAVEDVASAGRVPADATQVLSVAIMVVGALAGLAELALASTTHPAFTATRTTRASRTSTSNRVPAGAVSVALPCA